MRRLPAIFLAGILAAEAADSAAQERVSLPTPCLDASGHVIPEDSAAVHREVVRLLRRPGNPRENLQAARRLLRTVRGRGLSVRDTLLASDLAFAGGHEEEAGDLLADAAERGAGELTPLDWLILARRDEARADYASATTRYTRYLRSLEGSEEDTRWMGPRLKQLDVAARATALAAPPAHIPPAEARLALADGKAALARGDRQAAREKFGFALRIDPGYADAAVAAGALDAREGRTADAVREFRMALAADPERLEAIVPLANLLWETPDRIAKLESLSLLDRAAALRPELRDLQRQSAERWAQWGDPKTALERLDAWRARASASEKAQTDRLRGDLAARLTRTPEPAQAPEPERQGTSLAAEEWKKARIYADQGDDRQALDHLAVAERLDPKFAAAPELAAVIHERLGDRAAAEGALRRSVAAVPGRASAHERLALLLSQEPRGQEEAQEQWLRAQEAGSAEASFYLARIAEGAGQSSRAETLYARYLTEAQQGAHAAEARASLASLSGRRGRIRSWGAGAAALAALLAGVVVYRRRSGRTVEEWLTRHPSQARAARPILGRLQHEVVKHGNLLLRDASVRLAASPGEVADLLEERLYGSAPERRGLVSEGRRALSELVSLARSDGTRLNLRHRDPLLCSAVVGLDALSEAEPAIRRIRKERGDVAPAVIEKAVNRLSKASALFSAMQFRDIDRTLDLVATTVVSPDDLVALLEQVAAERQLPAPRLTTKGLPEAGKSPWQVRIPSGDWETIWRNIFANTLSALRATRDAEPKLALFGSVVRDSVTARPKLRFALADNAPGTLTTEMIQGRAADRGWGVVAELVRAYGGTIAVSPSVDPQYTKRVILEVAASETP